VEEATKLVDVSLEAGLSMFDSADVYSDGAAEEILGKAIRGRRDQVILSTKATFRSGPGPNDVGSSRHHLIKACEAVFDVWAQITSIFTRCTASTLSAP
jgi:aryl-alcohol dehydrogenase-like predicted oxidoreductase